MANFTIPFDTPYDHGSVIPHGNTADPNDDVLVTTNNGQNANFIYGDNYLITRNSNNTQDANNNMSFNYNPNNCNGILFKFRYAYAVGYLDPVIPLFTLRNGTTEYMTVSIKPNSTVLDYYTTINMQIGIRFGTQSGLSSASKEDLFNIPTNYYHANIIGDTDCYLYINFGDLTGYNSYMFYCPQANIIKTHIYTEENNDTFFIKKLLYQN